MNEAKLAKSIERVDLGDGGLFILRLEVDLPMATMEKITVILNKAIRKSCDGEVLILPSIFGEVAVLKPEDLNKLGWFKEIK